MPASKVKFSHGEKEYTLRLLWCDRCGTVQLFDTNRAALRCTVCQGCFSCSALPPDKCLECRKFEEGWNKDRMKECAKWRTWGHGNYVPAN